jgi:hypothetical protein
MPEHRSAITLAQGARGQHEIIRPGQHGAGYQAKQVAAIGTIAIEETRTSHWAASAPA